MIKKYRFERKGRRSFDTGLEYAPVSRLANQEPRTAKSAVRATRFMIDRFALDNQRAPASLEEMVEAGYAGRHCLTYGIHTCMAAGSRFAQA